MVVRCSISTRGWQGFHPDLVVVRRENKKLVIDILEPHRTGEDDTFSKAKRLATYAEAHGLEIGKAMMLKVDGGKQRSRDIRI